jgi:hypothetical protein
MPNQTSEAKNSPQKTNQKSMTPDTKVQTKTKIKSGTKIIIGAILAVGVAIGVGAVILFFGGGPAETPAETARFEVEFGPVNKATWDSSEVPDGQYDKVVNYFKNKFDDFFPPEERDDVIYMGSNEGAGLEDWQEDNHLWGRDKDGAGGVILDTFYFTHAHRIGDYGNTFLKTINDKTECDKINEFSLTPETLTINPSEITATIPYGNLPNKVDPILKDNRGNDLDKTKYHIRYKSLNPEVAVVYPDGHVLPVSPGSTEIKASVCGLPISNPVSVEVTREGFSNYNLTGQVNTRFINGVARSKVIDLGDLSGKYIKKLTLYLNISNAYKEAARVHKKLSGEINFYASNDNGNTWVKADPFQMVASINFEKRDDTRTGKIEYPVSITFDFTHKRPGNQLRLAMEIIENASPADVPATITEGKEDGILPEVDLSRTTRFVGNTFGNIKALDTQENINSGIYGLLAVDDLEQTRYFGSTRYPVTPPTVAASDFDPVYTKYYTTRYRQTVVNWLFGFEITDRENRKGITHDVTEWLVAPQKVIKPAYHHKTDLPLYTTEGGYAPASVDIHAFITQNIGFAHLALVKKDATEKWNEIGVLVVPAPHIIIHSLKGTTDLTTNAMDFAMPTETFEAVPPEVTFFGTIETPEFTLLPPSLTLMPGTTAPPPGDPAICDSPTIIYRGHNRAIIKCMPSGAYKDKTIKAFYGEKTDLSDQKEVKVYKDHDGKNYFVLRGLRGGEFDDKNDEGYLKGRFPYYFKFESEGKSSPVHSFMTLNRPQTIAYLYNLIYAERIDFLSFEELKDYRGDRKDGIDFYDRPKDQEPLTIQGVKYSLINAKEFISRLKVTAEVTGNEEQAKRLYQIIHDRIYDDNLEKHFDQAGVDFWVAQMEKIEEAKRIDLLGVIFGMMTSPEFFNTMVEQTGGDKSKAQAELAYLIVLQRGGDEPGVNYLKTNFKKNKEMREYLLKVDPEEYDKTLEEIEKDESLGRKAAIAKLYETIYGRPADVAGVDFWDKFVDTETEKPATIQKLKEIFLASDEFKNVVKD